MSFSLLLVSFLGGVFTVLAPCTLPLLPVLIGTGVSQDGKHHKHRALIIVGAFAFSVLLFSLVLNWLSKNLGISQADVTSVAGIILILFGFFMVFPQPWQWITHALKIDQRAGRMAASRQKNIWGDIGLGFLLGPILQSCSPTYGILLATILPSNFLRGFINIIAFVLGLSLMLLLIIYGGKSVMTHLRWLSNPHGIARKILAIIVIVTGVLVVTGWEKQLGVWLTEYGIGLDTTLFEYNLLQSSQGK